MSFPYLYYLSAQVALRGWLQQNFSSVVAMFEDRYELWTIQKRPITEGTTTKGGRSKEQASQAKGKDTSDELKLTRIELPARRSKELKGLTGWYAIPPPYTKWKLGFWKMICDCNIN